MFIYLTFSKLYQTLSLLTKANLIISFLLFFALSSCKKENGPDPEEDISGIDINNIYLNDYYLIDEHSKLNLKNVANFLGFSDVADQIKYDVKVYYAEYNTVYNDSIVNASGLIIVPQNVNHVVPIMSINHGTIFSNENAPSDYESISEKELLAGTGYLTVIPDYIGFGSTASILHPYYDKENITAPVIDMVRAGREFANEESIIINDKLFMFGYSEGGYVTMATHQAIQNLNNPKFEVTASCLGAGGYNLTGVLDELISKTTYASPNYLAFIVHSYNTTNKWGDSLSQYFKEPYASNIPDLFNGNFNSSQINSALTNTISDLLTSDFLDTLSNKYTSDIISELELNSVYDWLPINPIRMYHGTSDDIVPFSDSQWTYDNFKNNGVNNVEFVSIPGGTHSTSIYNMARDAIFWFKAFQIP